MPQRARIFKVNCCLKVHNAHLKLLSPIGDKHTVSIGQQGYLIDLSHADTFCNI